MSITIRRATEADIPELARLVAALAAWEQSLDPRVDFDWDGIRDAPNWLRLVLNRGHHAVWVADAGGSRLVGHLWIRLKHNTEARFRRRSAISARLLWTRAFEDAG